MKSKQNLGQQVTAGNKEVYDLLQY